MCAPGKLLGSSTNPACCRFGCRPPALLVLAPGQAAQLPTARRYVLDTGVAAGSRSEHSIEIRGTHASSAGRFRHPVFEIKISKFRSGSLRWELSQLMVVQQSSTPFPTALPSNITPWPHQWSPAHGHVQPFRQDNPPDEMEGPGHPDARRSRAQDDRKTRGGLPFWSGFMCRRIERGKRISRAIPKTVASGNPPLASQDNSTRARLSCV
jgi:hypothetical protein